MGQQPLHRAPDRTDARGLGRRFLGLLDARRHVGRRHGLHLRARRATARARSGCRRSCWRPSASCRRRCPSRWIPVVYDFAINEHGSMARAARGRRRPAARRLLPTGRAALPAPGGAPPHAPRARRPAAVHPGGAPPAGIRRRAADAARPDAALGRRRAGGRGRLEELLAQNGFDRAQHEQIRADLRSGRIGLAMNRLPPTTRIEDVPADALFEPRAAAAAELRRARRGGAARRARWPS